VAGRSVLKDPIGVRKVVGFMPDFFGVYDNMKVWEYLDFFGRSYGVAAARRATMIDELLNLVDLGHKRDEFVMTLSRGMKQRLSLARTMIHDPALLILDEPASGLDPRARIELRELLKELRALGKTVMISSHILTELAEMCDSVAVIQKGRILATGTVEEILERVRQRRILSVRLAGPAGPVERFLLEQPGVVNVHDAGGRLEFEFEGGDGEQVALVARLVAAGFPLLEFSAHRAGLEDLFIEITAGSAP
jgi:ABC-2 type transport system ATP-binding protein